MKTFFSRDLQSKISRFVSVHLCILFVVTIAKAKPANEFAEANKLYAEKNFSEAIVKFERMIKEGYTAPEVYYNLGNAYYKNGNLAAAVLNYERARRLAPADEDIEFNLKVANAATIDKIEPAPRVFYMKWWEDFVNSKPADQHSQQGIVFLWIAFFSGAIYLFSRHSVIKRIAFFTGAALLAAALFNFYLSSSQVRSQESNRSAIIFSASAYVKSSPDDNSTNLFMLHSGTKVEVKDELEGWKRIRIANGNEGWIKSDQLETI